ncbi:MAG: c-type cytochrome domain-containing protein [Nevskiales bacterium]
MTACSGDGEGLDENGLPLPPGGAPPAPMQPTIESIQAQVFTPICTECHAGASASADMRLDDAETSHAMLVMVRSNEVPALFRVQPGDPDNSYLVHKIEGRQAVGGRMPLGRPPLSAAMIANIRQWISAGAMPPAAGGSGGTGGTGGAGGGAGMGGGGGSGGSGGAGGQLQPSIVSIQEQVFTPICAECHAGAFPSGALRLEDTQTSHAMLVNVRSAEVLLFFRVEPGNPDNSYLIQKLEGRALLGGRMPLGRPPLSPETIAVIRQWITEGAAPPPVPGP